MSTTLISKLTSGAVSVLVWLAILFPSPVHADSRVSAGTQFTFAENLQNDTMDVSDTYSTFNGSLNLYPLPSLEVSLMYDYSGYSDQNYLGNYSVGGCFKFVPIPVESRFGVYIFGNFNGRRYALTAPSFDNNTFDLTGAAGYRVTDWSRIRGGIAYRSVGYLANDWSDQESIELFAGANATLPLSNVFDIEIGYSFASYERVTQGDSVFIPVEGRGWEHMIEGAAGGDALNLYYPSADLKSFHLSPRFSRPLGSRTGMSVTYTYREFKDTDDAMVRGADFESLSPWLTVWHGQSVSVNVKTYLIPGVIASVGFGYFEKTFLKTLEQHDLAAKRAEWDARYEEDPENNVRLYKWEQYLPLIEVCEDISRQVFINVQKPLVLSPNLVVEPSLNFQYRSNSSHHPLYNYSGATITLGVNVRM
jgi:hypothetical protein